MHEKHKIRERFLAGYKRLSPFEQILLQLCSVICEPTNKNIIFKCLRRTGITFPEEKIISPNALIPYLTKLQNMGLIDEHFQCHTLCMEMATRKAVAAGCMYDLGAKMIDLELVSNWSCKHLRDTWCLSCQEKILGQALKTQIGLICLPCVKSQMRAVFEKENLAALPISRFTEALSPKGRLSQRLMVLWRFEEVAELIREHSASDVHELMEHLVRNMGYIQPHPLSHPVRQAASDACRALGESILPLLLRACDSSPWQLYANVVMVAGSIAPEEGKVQKLLRRAALDPNPEVRKRVAFAIHSYRSPWTRRVFKILARDPDPGIRKLAREPVDNKVLFETEPNPQEKRASMALGYYDSMVKAVQDEVPLPYYYHTRQFDSSFKDSWLLMRDMRIGIYTGNRKLYYECYRKLFSPTNAHYEFDPLALVCNNPFDRDWFSVLPIELQASALAAIFNHTILHNELDDEALAYALDKGYLNTVREHSVLYYDLVSRLLVGASLVDFRKLIPEIDESGYTAGLKGWIYFLEGKNDEAIQSFEDDLKKLRRKTGKRNGYFIGIAGLFFILALLKRHDPSLTKMTDKLIGHALSFPYQKPFLSSAYRSLRAVNYFQDYELEKAREIIETKSNYRDNISTFFSALASYWIDNKLSKEKIDALSEIFVKARKVGLKWLAMESAMLLWRAGQSRSIYLDYASSVLEETGLESFVSSIQVEEPWRKSLNALINVTTSGQQPTEKSPNMRLVWLVDYQNSRISLFPKEQKFTAKGTWTRGRSVALSRLYSGDKLDYICEQDHVIRATLERESAYNYGSEYCFNWSKALPALVGHPLLFLVESPFVSVEFVRGEPEVLVDETGSSINVRFSTEVSDGYVVLTRETPTRFKVVELSEEHRRIARILGDNGLQVPVSAKKDVLSAIGSISSLVTVYSDMEGRSEDIEEITADPRIYIHLLPSGSGFRLEMFVKPFTKGGPYLKPGMGADNIIAEIDGKRLQTKRDLTLEEGKAITVETGCPALSTFAETDRQWFLDKPDDCLEILLDLKALQDKDEIMVEWPEGERLKVTHLASFKHLHLNINSKTDWFELSGELRLDDNLVVDMKRLLDLLQHTNNRFVPLDDGQFVALTQEFRKRLDELSTFLERRGKTVRIHPLAALAMEDSLSNLFHLDGDKAWSFRLERIKDGQKLTPPVPSTLKGDLRDYQLEGYQWLARLAYMGVGACLADDMGLGKTVQALAIILLRAHEGPTLVVSPASVCMNWLAEASRFAPTLNVNVFGGNNRETLVKNLKHLDMLVSSYGLLQQEAELLASVEWQTIVLDEAQAIKNFTTKRSQAAMILQGGFKVLTTGTPIENHLGELLTLFNFINPGLLGSRKRFNERFAIPIERYNDRGAKQRLKKLIQPFVLRRIKSDVLDELPPRTEITLQVEMSQEETAFYEALRQQAIERLEQDKTPIDQKHIRILAEIMKLRQACCNPRLVMPESDLSSSKLDLFSEVVSELLENRHKALVFSQFVGHLNLIRELLDEKKIDYRYLDGSTPVKKRKREVDSFQAGVGDLFLISLRAGGLGLNLTAADYVIHMDPWWNPAVEDQASDRAHRIGQQRPVTIYRLVTKNTIEDKIVKLHQQKRDLARSLLDGSDISGRISAEELLKLIRE